MKVSYVMSRKVAVVTPGTTLQKEFYRSRRYNTPMAIIMIDIDDFMETNDKHGHQYSDRVLQTVAEIIRCQTRDADVSVRYGREEFIVLTHGSETQHTSRLAERLRAAISESGVTVSCGVAHYPNVNSRFPDDLIRLSGQALCEAKRKGKNQIVCRSEEMAGSNNVT